MDYNIGQFVAYNGATYVILSVEKQNDITGTIRTILHIRNVVSNDTIFVPSNAVQILDLNSGPKMSSVKNSYDDFEASADSAEQDLIENKTEYINSLFNQIGSESTAEFFNLENDPTNEITDEKVERVFEDATDSTDVGEKNFTADIVQNFALPRTGFIKPRRKTLKLNKNTEVNATFSDLDVVGIIPTRELGKTNEVVNNSPKVQDVHEPQAMIQPRRVVKEESNQLLNSAPSVSEYLKNHNLENTDSTKQNQFKVPEDISQLIKEDATSVHTIIEPGFSESTEDDLSITSETKKLILEGLNDKALKFKEKQREILATSPIDTRKLAEHLKNHPDDTEILDELTGDSHQNKPDENLQDSLVNFTESPQDILAKSQIYKSFRKMTRWFIGLAVVTFLVPIIAIILKIAGNYATHLQKPMAASNIFNFSFDLTNISVTTIINFVSSVLLLVVAPVVAFVTIIYAIVYICVSMRRQYRRLAFFNYQLQKETRVVDSLQDFSNESSVFMLKLHNENKEMKKQIRKLTKLSGINMVRNLTSTDQKDVH